MGCSENINPKAENSKNSAPKKVTIDMGKVNEDIAKRLKAQGRINESAEMYARIGELLLLPEGFVYANSMFEKALRIDPNNPRANFYSAFLAPFVKFEGFLERFKIVMKEDNVNRIRREILKSDFDELKDFVLKMKDKKGPFKNYGEVQQFVKDEIIPELEKSIIKINNLKDNGFEIKISLARLGLDNDYKWEYTKNCNRSIENNEWECTYEYFEYSIPRIDRIKKATVDNTDVMILNGYFVTLLNYAKVATSYKVQGLRKFLDELDIMDGEFSDKDFTEKLVKYEGLFKIDEDQRLRDVQEDTVDILKNFLYFASVQDKLCKSNERVNNLITSYCITTTGVLEIDKALSFLAGPEMYYLGKNQVDDQKVEVLVDLNVLFNGEITDIKNLLPNSFDIEGRGVNYPDPTFGGLFPDADIIGKLKATRKTRIGRQGKKLLNRAEDIY